MFPQAWRVEVLHFTSGVHCDQTCEIDLQTVVFFSTKQYRQNAFVKSSATHLQGFRNVSSRHCEKAELYSPLGIGNGYELQAGPVTNEGDMTEMSGVRVPPNSAHQVHCSAGRLLIAIFTYQSGCRNTSSGLPILESLPQTFSFHYASLKMLYPWLVPIAKCTSFDVRTGSLSILLVSVRVPKVAVAIRPPPPVPLLCTSLVLPSSALPMRRPQDWPGTRTRP